MSCNADVPNYAKESGCTCYPCKQYRSVVSDDDALNCAEDGSKYGPLSSCHGAVNASPHSWTYHSCNQATHRLPDEIFTSMLRFPEDCIRMMKISSLLQFVQCLCSVPIFFFRPVSNSSFSPPYRGIYTILFDTRCYNGFFARPTRKIHYSAPRDIIFHRCSLTLYLYVLNSSACPTPLIKYTEPLGKHTTNKRHNS